MRKECEGFVCVPTPEGMTDNFFFVPRMMPIIRTYFPRQNDRVHKSLLPKALDTFYVELAIILKAHARIQCETRCSPRMKERIFDFYK